MSEQQPPSGTPEYLDSGGGSPIQPEATPPAAPSGGRRGRRTWWIGGAAVVLLGLGAGAWAALGFFHQGEQPAAALPASTIAYVSVDLDPSGGQKIDAFRTLNKFPAFKDEVGIDSVDELRHKLGDELLSNCPGLDFDRDVDPWLGDRAAVALVDLPDSDPDSVVVVQVTDDAKARAGLDRLDQCATAGDAPQTGYVVRDGWAVLADEQAYAERVADAADKSTLADDASYRRWTDAVGEAGVVNAYASPTAGEYLGRKLEGMFTPYTLTTPDDGTAPDPFTEPGSAPSITSSAFRGAAEGDDPFTSALSEFHGGAATLRFTGDGLEFALAADASGSALTSVTGDTGGTLVQRLPDDTAAAAGATFPEGWLHRQLDQMSDLFGSGLSKDDAMRELSRDTGLDVPDDIETLLGSGLSVSVGKDVDLEAAENSTDLSGLPVAVTVKGDPTAIERVLDKIRAKTGDLPFLGSDSSGDLVAIGPSSAYRKEVLDGGGLGDDDTFRSVVPDAGDASSVLYINVDAFEPALGNLASGGSQGDIANVIPLRAVGLSAWNDGDVLRFSFKVSTN